MRKNRRKHKHRFKYYLCVVYYLDYEYDGERSQFRTLRYAVAVDYYDCFVQLIEDTFDYCTISRLSTFYSPVNRDFYSLI